MVLLLFKKLNFNHLRRNSKVFILYCYQACILLFLVKPSDNKDKGIIKGLLFAIKKDGFLDSFDKRIKKAFKNLLSE